MTVNNFKLIIHQTLRWLPLAVVKHGLLGTTPILNLIQIAPLKK